MHLLDYTNKPYNIFSNNLYIYIAEVLNLKLKERVSKHNQKQQLCTYVRTQQTQIIYVCIGCMHDMIVWYITISIEKMHACMHEWIIKLSGREKKVTLSTMSAWLGLRLGRLRCSTNQPSGTFNGDRITICNSFSLEFVGFSISMPVFGDMLLLGTHSLSESHSHSQSHT